MLIEKILEVLPPWVHFEGVNFEMQIINNGGSECRLVYDIAYADDTSKHKQGIDQYSAWWNPLLSDEPQYCGFLWLREGIETDEDLETAIDECAAFMQKNGFE